MSLWRICEKKLLEFINEQMDEKFNIFDCKIQDKMREVDKYIEEYAEILRLVNENNRGLRDDLVYKTQRNTQCAQEYTDKKRKELSDEIYHFIQSQKKELSDQLYDYIGQENSGIYSYITDCIGRLKEDICQFNNNQAIINMIEDLKRECDFSFILKFFNQSVSYIFPRIIILGIPAHGNLGDQAIAYAEKEFMTRYFPNTPYLELTWGMLETYHAYLLAHIREDDIILIHGGGFLGSLWKNEQDALNAALDLFWQNPIMIMPQTYWCDGDEDNYIYMNLFKIRLKKCKNICVCLREKQSEILFKERFPSISTALVPDMTLLLDEIRLPREKVCKVALIMRNDKEKVENWANDIKHYLDQTHFSYRELSTVIDKNISITMREAELFRLWKEISQAEMVITDRLHGMIFAILLGVPCIAMNNVSKKIEATYEWVNNLPQVRFANEFERVIEGINIFAERTETYPKYRGIKKEFTELQRLLTKFVLSNRYEIKEK